MSAEVPLSEKEIYEARLTTAASKKDTEAFFSVLSAINLALVGPNQTAGPFAPTQPDTEYPAVENLKEQVKEEIFAPWPDGEGKIIAYLGDGQSRLVVQRGDKNEIHLGLVDHVSLAEVKAKWAAMSAPNPH